MATFARKIGDGLNTVLTITGHKDLRLAEHYSKLYSDIQKDISIQIIKNIDHNLKDNKEYNSKALLFKTRS